MVDVYIYTATNKTVLEFKELQILRTIFGQHLLQADTDRQSRTAASKQGGDRWWSISGAWWRAPALHSTRRKAYGGGAAKKGALLLPTSA